MSIRPIINCLFLLLLEHEYPDCINSFSDLSGDHGDCFAVGQNEKAKSVGFV